MAKVIISEHSGFCSGVKRAIDEARKCGTDTVTLGEIIHNESVVKGLAECGVVAVDNIDDIKVKNCIIRSHGEAKAVYDKLTANGINIIDATCPFVKKTQLLVEKYHNLGYTIVIFGKISHPEIVGINGWCDNSAVVISDENQKINLNISEKICLVAQTTASKQSFEKIIKNIMSIGVKIVEVFNTICYTTQCRQEEALNLSKSCDLIVCVGSKTSSNTVELYNLAKQHCKNVIFCQNTEDINKIDALGFENIGIVAGASTPMELVREVGSIMEELKKEQVATEEIAKEKLADGNISMVEVMESLEKKKNFRRGQVLVATVVAITDEGLFLSLDSAKKEVLLPKSEINLDGSYDKESFKIGEEVSVKVVSNNERLIISRKLIEVELKEDEVVKEYVGGKEFSMSFNTINKGGLKGRLGTYNVFVPGSQIKIGFVNEKDFEKYKGKKLKLRVIKAEGKDLVASARVILEEEKIVKEDAFWGKIKEGEVIKGKVMRFTKFGAFVSVDGFDCLAHISDLSWENVKECEDILTLNETYDFKILKADRETAKVSLGLKQLTRRPIDIVAEKYPVNSIVKGTVVRLKSYGAFVELEPKVEGLIHISQVSHTYVENIAHAIKEGDEVDVMVIDIDKAKNKINLSIKALLPEPERQVSDNQDRPRNNNNNNNNRRPDNEREARADEITSWVTGDGATSIAELLSKLEKQEK